MPGPPPNPNAIRRNTRVGMTVLPASGRPGRPPKWPLAGRMFAGELAAWRELWKMPQAVAWERLALVRVVARYCRILVEAESYGDGADKARAEARQLEDRLGLTPKAMRSLMWVISDDEVGEKRDDKTGAAAQSASSGTEKSARRRLRAVDSA